MSTCPATACIAAARCQRGPSMFQTRAQCGPAFWSLLVPQGASVGQTAFAAHALPWLLEQATAPLGLCSDLLMIAATTLQQPTRRLNAAAAAAAGRWAERRQLPAPRQTYRPLCNVPISTPQLRQAPRVHHDHGPFIGTDGCVSL